jgi:hypothetical protein
MAGRRTERRDEASPFMREEALISPTDNCHARQLWHTQRHIVTRHSRRHMSHAGVQRHDSSGALPWPAPAFWLARPSATLQPPPAGKCDTRLRHTGEKGAYMQAGDAVGALVLLLPQRVSSSCRCIAAAVAPDQTQFLSNCGEKGRGGGTGGTRWW